jgi:hypothetical protein
MKKSNKFVLFKKEISRLNVKNEENCRTEILAVDASNFTAAAEKTNPFH